MSAFIVRRRWERMSRESRLDLPWGVFEFVDMLGGKVEERLTSAWSTRDQAREAARALNREEQ